MLSSVRSSPFRRSSIRLAAALMLALMALMGLIGPVGPAAAMNPRTEPPPVGAAGAGAGAGVGAGIEGRADPHWTWPLRPVPRVVRGFEPPDSPYGTGHRGVDLAAEPGAAVLAAGDGTVAFAGTVAGRGVVVVDHGRLDTTYQPVTGYVRSGQRVRAGEPIGVLQVPYSHCLPAACLHLGLRRGDVYLDPLTVLPDLPIRLKPVGGPAGRPIGAARW